MARPSPAVNETAHVADSQRSSDSLFKNKRSRTIAKGDGLGLRQSGARRRTLLCETPLTLTPRIAGRSFERLVRDYGIPSKRTASYLRSSERKSNDCVNQKRCVRTPSHVTACSRSRCGEAYLRQREGCSLLPVSLLEEAG